MKKKSGDKSTIYEIEVCYNTHDNLSIQTITGHKSSVQKSR